MNTLEFYVEKYAYNKGEEPDLSFIPKLMRRRLNPINKLALSTINECFSEEIENIIFTSKLGEIDKLFQIVKQYEENEISPTLFSSSVHNYSIGFFSFIKQYSKSYTALSAIDSTISNGLLSAIINNKNDVLFCYADSINKEQAVCMRITKKPIKPHTKKIVLKRTKEKNIEDDFYALIEFLEGKKDKMEFSLYSLERV